MTESLILISSVLIGVLFSSIFLKNKHNSKLLLTFSGAFFLAMTVLEILPQVYGHPSDKHDHHSIGLFVLLGVVIQYILETISKGVEHGHIHLHKKEQFPIGIFGGLFLHSVIEGIPVANAESHNFMWAIFVHNIPVSMILFSALCQHTESKAKRILFMTLLLIFMIPVLLLTIPFEPPGDISTLSNESEDPIVFPVISPTFTFPEFTLIP